VVTTWTRPGPGPSAIKGSIRERTSPLTASRSSSSKRSIASASGPAGEEAGVAHARSQVQHRVTGLRTDSLDHALAHRPGRGMDVLALPVPVGRDPLPDVVARLAVLVEVDRQLKKRR
jgi:hypothetical protein